MMKSKNAIQLLLAGNPERVQGWASWFALQDDIQILTAVHPGSLGKKLGAADWILIDAALFPHPRELVTIVEQAGGQANIHILLPELVAEQAELMERRLGSLPSVQGVYHGEVSPANLADLAEHILAEGQPLRRDLPDEIPGAVVIAVWNGAGGVGKTTVATNMAYEIARRELKTLLLDLDAPANATFVLGLRAEPNITHWRSTPTQESLSAVVQQVGSLDVLAGFQDVFAQAEAIETPVDHPASVRGLVDLAREAYQVIVIDTPQSPIAAHVLGLADQLVLVGRPNSSGAQRTAVAYRTAVERMAGGMPSEAVHVVLNRLISGHLLDVDEWQAAAAKSLGGPFPRVVTAIGDDVRIADAQNICKVPVVEVPMLGKHLSPLIDSVLPFSVGRARVGERIEIGPFVVVR